MGTKPCGCYTTPTLDGFSISLCKEHEPDFVIQPGNIVYEETEVSEESYPDKVFLGWTDDDRGNDYLVQEIEGEPYIKKSIADELARTLEYTLDLLEEPSERAIELLGKYKKSIGEE